MRPANKREEKQSQGTRREHEIGSEYHPGARGRVAPLPYRSEAILSGRPRKFLCDPGLAAKGSNPNLDPCFRPAGNGLRDEAEGVWPAHVARGATVAVRDDRVAASMISAVTMASATSTGGGAPSRRSAAIPA